tara:strand:+ start:139 stop:1077 length:939 start_codon:yes stop_codon:yes gene_type:complete
MSQIDDLLEKLPHSWQSAKKMQLARFHPDFHGDYSKWKDIVDRLPEIKVQSISLGNTVEVYGKASETQRRNLKDLLLQLSPWRKGPFSIFGVKIDSEWRSDWKWSRIEPILRNLPGARVLDIGCANGYFGWQLLSSGAALVLGVDPSILSCLQHQAINRYIQDDRNWVLPLKFEEIPHTTFEIVLSMGVIYHRREPEDHIKRLYQHTKPGGQVVLESIIAPGNLVIASKERYARMRNVYLVPSIDQLDRWMRSAGYADIQIVDCTITSDLEQRSTEWMTFKSLKHSLNPHNPQLTIEGHPRPMRAVLTGFKY